MVTLNFEFDQAFEHFFQQLRQVADPMPPLVVAWSGGLDSSVLLHALKQYTSRLSIPVSLSSVHVNHGLNESADQWQQHCEQLAQVWQVEHQTLRLDLKDGANIEARARAARYQALANILADQACLLTAHHQQDQAETVLARLLKGAGIQGLSGMRLFRPLGVYPNKPNQLLGRPLLNVSQAALQDYAKRSGLVWVTDPMNNDQHYERVFMRETLWPVLNQRYSDPAQSITMSARLLQAHLELLAEYQQQDWQAWSPSPQQFDWKILSQFSWPRQQALIARWFDEFHGLRLRQHHWQWFAQQVGSAANDKHPQTQVAGKPMQRYRNHIYYPAQAPMFHLRFDEPLALQTWLIKHWPWVGSDFTVPQCPLLLRNRTPTDAFGGESLKKWFQNRGVPPWLREAWPVVENEQGCYMLGVN